VAASCGHPAPQEYSRNHRNPLPGVCVGHPSEIDAVKALIAKLPPDSQRIVAGTAQGLRDVIAAAEDKQAVEIALTLVLAEMASRAGAK